MKFKLTAALREVLFNLIMLSFPLLLQAQTNITNCSREVLPLDGLWKFKLDQFDTGINSNGVQLMPQLPETIMLPGSTDQAGMGYRTQGITSLRLTRLFEYKGPAWYEKEIKIPNNWKNKEITLFLERAHWETRVWVNNQPVGRRESLSTPHIYDITRFIKPGKKNVIRIRVNNDKIYDLEYSHALSAETQTNWNGIIGKIQLEAADKVNINNISVFPQIAQNKAKVIVKINNPTGRTISGSLMLSVLDQRKEAPSYISPENLNFSGTDSIITVVTDFSLGKAMHLWDEFNPYCYSLTVRMKVQANSSVTYNDQDSTVFGMREIATEGTRISINGKPTFIRSTVNSAEFPITGYPSMDLSAWLKIFRTAKRYGLNGMRFHSWCPPEAAFEAADKVGMYLQIENSDWRFSVGKDSATNRFLTEEADRILKTYGNHPSFVFFCEGNELVGPTVKPFLSGLVKQWKAKDSRHLYTSGSGYPAVPENDYNDLYGARPQRWKEGLKGRFNSQPLNTLYDYSEYVSKYPIPMIDHEVGQWCVYPNFEEIPKYVGVLKPYNYELFKELLRDHGMLSQALQFTMASGKFQVIQKKEEIESYLRTPGFGGYTLLQLNDFPGQGTSPVGVVDVFWDPKPYVNGKEFSQFQASRVPLLRTASFTWTNDQMFKAVAEFANFGNSEMKSVVVHWALRYPDNQIYAEGDFEKTDIPIGSPFKLGELQVPLNKINQAVQLKLVINIPGTAVSNRWDVWVYPKELPEVNLKKVRIAHQWNNKLKKYIENGGKALLLADTSKIRNAADPVFSGISWNTVWSGMPPNLLGILCDPAHPALKNFPTEYFSNWQWFDVVRNSKPMILDGLPSSIKPVVQMIPDWNNPKKIGLIFEAKLGKGSILVSAIDLQGNMTSRPVARQLLYSLKKYIVSDKFQPQEILTASEIDSLFKQ